jgi:hypothetical protein
LTGTPRLKRVFAPPRLPEIQSLADRHCGTSPDLGRTHSRNSSSHRERLGQTSR